MAGGPSLWALLSGSLSVLWYQPPSLCSLSACLIVGSATRLPVLGFAIPYIYCISTYATIIVPLLSMNKCVGVCSPVPIVFALGYLCNLQGYQMSLQWVFGIFCGTTLLAGILYAKLVLPVTICVLMACSYPGLYLL